MGFTLIIKYNMRSAEVLTLVFNNPSLEIPITQLNLFPLKNKVLILTKIKRKEKA